MLITLGPRLKGVKAVSKMNRRWEEGGVRSGESVLYSLRCVEFAFCITAVLGS